MTSQEMYLTLLSNSSFLDYPENKTSSFTVKLPRTINLEGKYEIALCEISYPMTIDNVAEGHNSFVIQRIIKSGTSEENFDITYKLEVGHYRTIEEIVQALNHAVLHNTPGVDTSREDELEMFHYNVFDNSVKVDKATFETICLALTEAQTSLSGKRDRVVQVEAFFQNRLALQMGFEPDACVLTGKPSRNPCLKLGYPEQVFVYADIMEPHMFSDMHGQIIKAVQTTDSNQHYGDLCSRSYTDRNYYPVLRNTIDTISIDIRDCSTGVQAPFAFGNLYVLLHLRRALH
jgi:hypothetical protein